MALRRVLWQRKKMARLIRKSGQTATDLLSQTIFKGQTVVCVLLNV